MEAAIISVCQAGSESGRSKTPAAVAFFDWLFENDGPISDEYALMEIASVQWLVEESEVAAERNNPLLTIESLYDFAKNLATRMMGLGQYSVSEHRVLEWIPA